VRPAARSRTSTAEYLESLLVTVILALFGTSFVVQAFKIPSQSMEPTLLVGDHLLVNKFVFGGTGSWFDAVLPYRDIERGDIIVFKFPYQDHPHYVKRVVGVPGDRIRIEGQTVYVNSKPLDEPYAFYDSGASYDTLSHSFPPAGRDELLGNMQSEWTEEIFQHIENGELVVPPNRYFAMGDNRDHSWDSRYWGFVDREAIMGRPVVIYWSIESATPEYFGEGLAARLRGIAHTVVQIPQRARWQRMIRLIH
jgi:signal peptidase I